MVLNKATCCKQATCQVQGCKFDLTSSYCKRRHICKRHLEAESIDCGGACFRFCLQCAKLEPLDSFDGSKRSCRATLLRRRVKIKALQAAPGPVQQALTPLGALLGPSLLDCSGAPQDFGGSMIPPPLVDGSLPGLVDSPCPTQCAAPMPQQTCLAPTRWDSAHSSGSAGTGLLCCVPSCCSPRAWPRGGNCTPFAAASQLAFSANGIDASGSTTAGFLPQMQPQLLPTAEQPLLLAPRQAATLLPDPFDDLLQELLAEELARTIVCCHGYSGSDDDGSGRDGQTLTWSNSLESSSNGWTDCSWDAGMGEEAATCAALCAPSCPPPHCHSHALSSPFLGISPTKPASHRAQKVMERHQCYPSEQTEDTAASLPSSKGICLAATRDDEGTLEWW